MIKIWTIITHSFSYGKLWKKSTFQVVIFPQIKQPRMLPQLLGCGVCARKKKEKKKKEKEGSEVELSQPSQFLHLCSWGTVGLPKGLLGKAWWPQKRGLGRHWGSSQLGAKWGHISWERTAGSLQRKQSDGSHRPPITGPAVPTQSRDNAPENSGKCERISQEQDEWQELEKTNWETE